MNYKQARSVFPSYEEFCSVEKNRVRIHAIEKSIPEEHDVVLRRLAEMCGDEWPLKLLQWLYLGNNNRIMLIESYKELIRQADSGEMEIGTRAEAFDEKRQDALEEQEHDAFSS